MVVGNGRTEQNGTEHDGTWRSTTGHMSVSVTTRHTSEQNMAKLSVTFKTEHLTRQNIRTPHNASQRITSSSLWDSKIGLLAYFAGLCAVEHSYWIVTGKTLGFGQDEQLRWQRCFHCSTTRVRGFKKFRYRHCWLATTQVDHMWHFRQRWDLKDSSGCACELCNG